MYYIEDKKTQEQQGQDVNIYNPLSEDLPQDMMSGKIATPRGGIGLRR